jgi:hypothetical protein
MDDPILDGTMLTNCVFEWSFRYIDQVASKFWPSNSCCGFVQTIMLGLESISTNKAYLVNISSLLLCLKMGHGIPLLKWGSSQLLRGRPTFVAPASCPRSILPVMPPLLVMHHRRNLFTAPIHSPPPSIVSFPFCTSTHCFSQAHKVLTLLFSSLGMAPNRQHGSLKYSNCHCPCSKFDRHCFVSVMWSIIRPCLDGQW